MLTSLKQLEQEYLNAHQNTINVICHTIGIPLILVSIGVLPFMPLASLEMFAIGWAFQFIGHLFEGKKPSFFENPRYLIIGPICLAKAVWRKIADRRNASSDRSS